MGECGTSVILQWAKHRSGIDLVANRSQETAAVVAAEVVPDRIDLPESFEIPLASKIVLPSCAVAKTLMIPLTLSVLFKDSQRRAGVTVAVNAGAQRSLVAAESAIGNT